jgi:hypothetical protein
LKPGEAGAGTGDAVDVADRDRLPRAVRARRVPILAASVLLALGLTACGHRLAHPHEADNEGVYVDAGPVTYQVQLSRQLNPAILPDRDYLTGLPAGSVQPRPDELYFAIFLWAKNQTSSPQITASSFELVDTQGNKYEPIALDPNSNRYAWTSMTLKPLQIEPLPDSTAERGATQGAELLFKIKTSVYSNRPVRLEIRAPNQDTASVSLDL